MTYQDMDNLERNLKEAGRALPYPPTPALAGQVMLRLSQGVRPGLFSRRWARALLTVLILLAVLMLLPPARAAILDFIQIGVDRILLVTPTPPAKATPVATILPSQLDLAGETSLPEAQSRLDFLILLPTYPKDLGAPDHVYLQDTSNPMLVLVWLDREQPERVRLSLDEIPPDNWGLLKIEPPVVEETSVNGQPAVWAEGPYMLQISSKEFVMKRLIEGHVLIWTQGELTYRLETEVSLAEAIKIAESLR